MHLALKHDVRLFELDAEMIVGLLVVLGAFDDLKADCVITAGVEGKHSVTSLHYGGAALDFRTGHLTASEKDALMVMVRERLTTDFDAALESDHLHVEYQPEDGDGDATAAACGGLMPFIGAFNRRIVFEKLAKTEDEFGQPIEVWAPARSAMANRDDMTGDERFRAAQEMATRVSLFTTRWFQELNAGDWRIVHDGLVWDIKGLAEPKNTRHQWWQITAAAVGA